jgi:hypothetical protein
VGALAKILCTLLYDESIPKEQGGSCDDGSHDPAIRGYLFTTTFPYGFGGRLWIRQEGSVLHHRFRDIPETGTSLIAKLGKDVIFPLAEFRCKGLAVSHATMLEKRLQHYQKLIRIARPITTWKVHAVRIWVHIHSWSKEMVGWLFLIEFFSSHKLCRQTDGISQSGAKY